MNLLKTFHSREILLGSLKSLRQVTKSEILERPAFYFQQERYQWLKIRRFGSLLEGRMFVPRLLFEYSTWP